MTIFKGVRRALLGQLPLHARALLRGGGGPGAGAFLRPATSPELVVPEDAFLAYVRRRLLLSDPQLAGAVSCCRRGANGRVCGHPIIGDYGAHAVKCHVGGGPLRRHNALAHTLAQWLKQKCGAHVSLEQWLPHLDQPRPDGRVVRARLDVVFVDSDGTQHIVDISVADALVSDTSGELTRRAAHDFANVADREREKPRRYPGPNIIAFVLDTQGRLGREAQTFLRYVTRDADDGVVDSTFCVAYARQALSASLARQVCSQLDAGCPRGRGVHRAS